MAGYHVPHGGPRRYSTRERDYRTPRRGSRCFARTKLPQTLQSLINRQLDPGIDFGAMRILLPPMILIACTQALKGFIVMPHENCPHLLRDSRLPGIILPRATRRTPLAGGIRIRVHAMNT